MNLIEKALLFLVNMLNFMKGTVHYGSSHR